MSKKRRKTKGKSPKKATHRRRPKATADAGPPEPDDVAEEDATNGDRAQYVSSGPLSSMRHLVARDGGHNKSGLLTGRRPLWQWALIAAAISGLYQLWSRFGP